MESFGTYLKEERESRKVSLDAMSRATKVRRVILKAIEEDQGEALLPEVVIKGFIEAYARHLGLDSHTVLVKYAQWQEGNKTPERGDVRSPEKWRISPRSLVAGAAGVVAIIVIALLVALPSSPQKGAQEATIATSPPEQTTVVPSEGTPSSPVVSGVKEAEKETTPPAPVSPDIQVGHESAPAAPAPVAGPEHTLVITASERTWIQIQEGSALPRDVILAPGDNLTRTSSQPLAVVIGNAGGVTVSFDGRVLTSLGEAGQVVRLTLPSPQEG